MWQGNFSLFSRSPKDHERLGTPLRQKWSRLGSTLQVMLSCSFSTLCSFFLAVCFRRVFSLFFAAKNSQRDSEISLRETSWSYYLPTWRGINVRFIDCVTLDIFSFLVWCTHMHRHLNKTVGCVNDFITLCLSYEFQKTYREIIRGTVVMIDKLCVSRSSFRIGMCVWSLFSSNEVLLYSHFLRVPETCCMLSPTIGSVQQVQPGLSQEREEEAGVRRWSHSATATLVLVSLSLSHSMPPFNFLNTYASPVAGRLIDQSNIYCLLFLFRYSICPPSLPVAWCHLSNYDVHRECRKRVTEKTCGNEAADVAEQIMVISGGDLVKPCSNYTVFSTTCNHLLSDHTFDSASSDLRPSMSLMISGAFLLISRTLLSLATSSFVGVSALKVPKR